MQSRNPSGWLTRNIFRVLLFVLGIGLELACLLSKKFRLQVTRELTIQIGSSDGVFRHYKFSPRAVKSHAGVVIAPTLSLCFCNARLGFITLLSPRACGRIMRALLEGTAEYKGNAVLVLWFFGLTRFVLPIRKTGPLQIALPNAYIAPSDTNKVAEQITREPPVTELDTTWQLAHQRRAQMLMLKVAAGESTPQW